MRRSTSNSSRLANTELYVVADFFFGMPFTDQIIFVLEVSIFVTYYINT